MTDILADQTHERAEYISGLRALADFLDATPSMPVNPYGDRVLVPLTTNAPVEELAAAQGLTVAYDAEGNASVTLTFGPVEYIAFGYVDFQAHAARNAERAARQWAKGHGMEIKPAAETPEFLPVVPLAESPAAVCGSQCPEHPEHQCRRSPGHQAGICRDQKQKGTESCTWAPATQAVTA